jgi:hypothetical protein
VRLNKSTDSEFSTIVSQENLTIKWVSYFISRPKRKKVKMKRKGLILILIIILVQVCCSKRAFRKPLPEMFQDLPEKHFLASRIFDYNQQYTIKKRFLIFTVNSALVRMEAKVTHNFYIDFKDGNFAFKENQNVVDFTAPPIYIESTIDEMQYFPIGNVEPWSDKEIERSKIEFEEWCKQEGLKQLKEPSLVNECKEAMRKFLLDFLPERGYGNVSNINVTFDENQIPN